MTASIRFTRLLSATDNIAAQLHELHFVLPIGGLKEKSIAALRAGIKKILIPKLNDKDIPDLPDEVRQRLKIIPVETVEDVLREAWEPPDQGS